MDVIAGRWGGVAAVDVAAGKTGWLPPLTRPRDKGKRMSSWTRLCDDGVVSAVDVVMGRWGGVADVDVVTGTARLLLPLLRPRDKGEELPPWTRSWGQRTCFLRGRGWGVVGRGCCC